MKILFVFAHPDDETILAGGTILRLSKKHQVILLTATKGDAGETGNVCAKEDLAEIRTQELLNASEILGIFKVIFLSYKDGQLKNASLTKLTKDVLKVMKKEAPDMVFTFNENGFSNHPDHMTISKSTIQAFGPYQKSSKKPVQLYCTVTPKTVVSTIVKKVFSFGFGEIKEDLHEPSVIVDVNPVFNKKLQALDCHRTQKHVVLWFYKLSKLAQFRKEYFCLLSSNTKDSIGVDKLI